jgi:hypothetical protein
MMNRAWYLNVSRNATSRSAGGTKSRQYPVKSQAYLNVQGLCRIVVSIKGKFFKLASH